MTPCKGKHTYRVILRKGYEDDVQIVVRWCYQCGAVTVDSDYDNQTNPGYYGKLQLPELAIEYEMNNQ